MQQTDASKLLLDYAENASEEAFAALVRQYVHLAYSVALRRFFSKHGVSSTTAALAGALSANSVHAAPAGLITKVTAMAVTKGTTAGGSTLALIKGALKFMFWTKAKVAVALEAGVVLTAATNVAVNEVKDHKPLPWRVHEGLITEDQLGLQLIPTNLPTEVVVVEKAK